MTKKSGIQGAPLPVTNFSGAVHQNKTHHLTQAMVAGKHDALTISEFLLKTPTGSRRRTGYEGGSGFKYI